MVFKIKFENKEKRDSVFSLITKEILSKEGSFLTLKSLRNYCTWNSGEIDDFQMDPTKYGWESSDLSYITYEDAQGGRTLGYGEEYQIILPYPHEVKNRLMLVIWYKGEEFGYPVEDVIDYTFGKDTVTIHRDVGIQYVMRDAIKEVWEVAPDKIEDVKRDLVNKIKGVDSL